MLTAAHCFEGIPKATVYVYRTEGGSVLIGEELIVHPQWNGSFDSRTGYDLAIIRMSEPAMDAGPQPVIYEGRAEKGRLLTFAGFGSRGIGSTGEADRFYDPQSEYEEKAAAQGMIDMIAEAVTPLPDEETDAGNYLGIFLSKEDGSLDNPFGGVDRPVTRLAGLLGTGDSGSGAWMQLADGRWVLAGVGSNGSGTAAYGDSAWFVRLSTLAPWIRSVFPGARFAQD